MPGGRLAFALLVALPLATVSAAPAAALADETDPFTLQVPRLVMASDLLSSGQDPGTAHAEPSRLSQVSPGAGAPSASPLRGDATGRPPLRQGSWEAGVFGAFMLSGAGGPDIRTVVRAYWLLPRVGYTFWETPWYPGSFQVYLEPAAAYISHPTQTYLVGVNVILRHTFLVWRRVSPYLEGGAGLLNSNLRTRALGESIEFSPQVGVGFHLHVADRLSLNAGFRWLHISNAGLAEQNLGINSYFPYAGFTYFF